MKRHNIYSKREAFTAYFSTKKRKFKKKLAQTFAREEKTPYLCNAFEKQLGCLAQLVQSICLTSRGSAVRIRQHPHEQKLFKYVFGRLAQLVQSICLTSRGSAVRIRQHPHEQKLFKYVFGRLAQLVQSICLTSRGSAVRIRQRPQHQTQTDR